MTMNGSGNNTALATVGSFAPALIDQRAMAEEMEGLQASFDRVKIPSGGGLAFEIPGDSDDDVETVKELVGVIVDHHPVNAYWQTRYAGGNNPPDCASMDGKVGVATPDSGLEWAGRSRDCKTCPFNQFGSDADGRGKACKNMHRLYILREGEAFPLLLTLPPTSLKNFGNFLAKRVLGKGLRSTDVVVRIGLKRVQNADGINYSQATFAVAGVLPDEARANIQKYSAGIRAWTRGVELTGEDYEAGEYAAAGAASDDEDAPF